LKHTTFTFLVSFVMEPAAILLCWNASATDQGDMAPILIVKVELDMFLQVSSTHTLEEWHSWSFVPPTRFVCRSSDREEAFNIITNVVKLRFSYTFQLKNMVAALHSSRSQGTKSFQRNGITFGWETIQDMWERDLKRTHPVTGRQLTSLPGMKASYIVRDSWTRLNVKPAKIMQVRCS